MNIARVLVFGALFIPSTFADPIPLFVNYGTLTNTPQIDAVAFANYGTFSVFVGGEPYQFTNTRYFTNYGLMVGIPGFYFETMDDYGYRGPAEVFVNDLGARIEASGSMRRVGTVSLPPTLYINAKRIINRGVLQAEHDGLVEIFGDQVDLANSAIGIRPIINGTGYQITVGDPEGWGYWPDEGIEDEYWGLGEQDPRFSSAGLISSYAGAVNARAPTHCTTNRTQDSCIRTSFFLSDPISFVYTNTVDETNWIIQILLVDVQDPNLHADAAFYPSSNPTNYFNTVTLQLSAGLTNPVTGSVDLMTLYLIDRLASETNFVALTNLATQGRPFRASTYELTRNTPREFIMGRPSNAVFRTNLGQLVFDQGGSVTTNYVTNVVEGRTNIVTNVVRSLGYGWAVVTNLYAAIGASLTNIVRPVPNVPGASTTNASGRVVISAKSLNLENTRLRADGVLIIDTDNLISSKGAAIDSGNLYYRIDNSSGTLRLQSLAIPEVQRLAGYIQAWSALWTNQLNLLVSTSTNMPVETNITDNEGNTVTITNLVPTNIVTTNVINIGIHVCFVNASAVGTRYPVYIAGFATTTTNLYVYDITRVRNQLALGSTSLTIEPGGGLIVGEVGSSVGQVLDFDNTKAPNLRTFTNYGLAVVTGGMLCGPDRPVPYTSFVNLGTNLADWFSIRSRYFENGGYLATGYLIETSTNRYILGTVGQVQIEADEVKLDQGIIQAGGDLTFASDRLKLRQATNVARRIVLNVTNLLTDAGPGSMCLLAPEIGVQIVRKPVHGDLLGTTIRAAAARFQAVPIIWAAEDRGPVPEGFSDNLALGRLVITPDAGGSIVLSGAIPGSVMYVDFLEFGPSALSRLTESLRIDDGFKVYFADANVPVQQLTNLFAGRLFHVNFAGPNSSVPVSLPDGRTLLVNRVFRNSLTIDSDADGIVNGLDLYPFDGVRISISPQLEEGFVLLRWNAAALTTYTIEVSGSLLSQDWTPVLQLRNDLSSARELEARIPIELVDGARFLRVTYEPGK